MQHLKMYFVQKHRYQRHLWFKYTINASASYRNLEVQSLSSNSISMWLLCNYLYFILSILNFCFRYTFLWFMVDPERTRRTRSWWNLRKRVMSGWGFRVSEVPLSRCPSGSRRISPEIREGCSIPLGTSVSVDSVSATGMPLIVAIMLLLV